MALLQLPLYHHSCTSLGSYFMLQFLSDFFSGLHSLHSLVIQPKEKKKKKPTTTHDCSSC